MTHNEDKIQRIETKMALMTINRKEQSAAVNIFHMLKIYTPYVLRSDRGEK